MVYYNRQDILQCTSFYGGYWNISCNTLMPKFLRNLKWTAVTVQTIKVSFMNEQLKQRSKKEVYIYINNVYLCIHTYIYIYIYIYIYKYPKNHF